MISSLWGTCTPPLHSGPGRRRGERVPPLESVLKHVSHGHARDDLQRLARRRRHLVLHVAQVAVRHQHPGDAVLVRRDELLLQAPHGQHQAPQGHLAGHGGVRPHWAPREEGDQRRAHGDTRGGAVLGDGALGQVDVDRPTAQQPVAPARATPRVVHRYHSGVSTTGSHESTGSAGGAGGTGGGVEGDGGGVHARERALFAAASLGIPARYPSPAPVGRGWVAGSPQAQLLGVGLHPAHGDERRLLDDVA
mmetsp:Transcript_21880/g.54164  ORF Transcript_21880/g.54164 Transcript_21880/m.54164 type:complete len:250 (+) Transcript_21880:465-1214(+)